MITTIIGDATIHQGDVRAVLATLPDCYVQCVVTSPPYWGLRDYGVDGQIGLEPTLKEWVETMVDVFREVRRVLRDDGVAWVNMGDAYAAGHGGSTTAGNYIPKTPSAPRVSMMQARDDVDVGGWGKSDASLRAVHAGMKPKDLMGQPWRLAFGLQDDGWYLRQDIIWHKPNPMPESVTDRCTKAHEYVFLLSKSARYHYDAEAIKEPVNGGAHARRPGNKSHKGTTAYENGAAEHRTKAGLVSYARKLAAAGSGTKNNISMDAALEVMPDARNKRSVWTVGSEPFTEAHFATFPTKLIEPCILAGARPGDVVLDPFHGAGTTGVVALAQGRRYVGIELNPDYIAMSVPRLESAGAQLRLLA